MLNSQRRPPSDASSRNSLARFENNLLKKYPEQLEQLDEVAAREIVELKEMFEFIDEVYVSVLALHARTHKFGFD
jgi:hypothetical protein